MLRSIVLAVAAAALAAGLVFAEPRLEVRYHSGVPELVLAGSYPNSRYTVMRATTSTGAFEPITDLNTLCMGSCYALDYDAAAGRSYWYRFELVLDDGTLAHFGPYAVTYPASLMRQVGATRVAQPGARCEPGRARPHRLAGRLAAPGRGRAARSPGPPGPHLLERTDASWRDRDQLGRANGRRRGDRSRAVFPPVLLAARIARHPGDSRSLITGNVGASWRDRRFGVISSWPIGTGIRDPRTAPTRLPVAQHPARHRAAQQGGGADP